MTLVLLPGMNCSTRLWSELDLPDGHLAPDLTEPTLDACVERLLDELPPRFALAGLSLGAIVAMALVRTAPERVSRLALLATNANAPTPRQQDSWAATLRELEEGDSARQVQQRLLPALLSAAARSPERDETVLAMADDTGSSRLVAQLRLQSTRVDELRSLSRITVPTLVLHGDADALCPVPRHYEIAAAVPDARLVTLPGAGHLVPLERPREVSAALSAWLGQPAV